MNKQFKPLSPELERIRKLIFNSALPVHNALGPGLLEKVYEVLRLDVLVEDCVISELKAIEAINTVWEAQILSHLKLTNLRSGYLINFNSVLLKDG